MTLATPFFPAHRENEKSSHPLGIEGQGVLRGSWNAARLAAHHYYLRANAPYSYNVQNYVYESRRNSVLRVLGPKDDLAYPFRLNSSEKVADLKKVLKRRNRLLVGDSEKILAMAAKDMTAKMAHVADRIDEVKATLLPGEKTWLMQECRTYKDYTSRIAQKSHGARLFRGAAFLSFMNAGLTLLQLYSALRDDNTNPMRPLAIRKNVSRTLGEVFGGDGGAMFLGSGLSFATKSFGAKVRFAGIAGSMIGGYLGTVYGGRAAEALYAKIYGNDAA